MTAPRVLRRAETWAIVAVVVVLLGVAVLAAATRPNAGRGGPLVATAASSSTAPPSSVAPAPSTSAHPAPTAPAASPTPTTRRPAPPPAAPVPAAGGPIGPVTLTGCPPPPQPPKPPAPPPAHPAVLVPEAALPAPPAASPRVSVAAAIGGKGMWIWEPTATEGGNADAIVNRAVAAHLSQVWVRVGDSFNGFYGAGFLNTLVPLAHRQGLAVIGWGFPYLYDPVGDAGWTAQAMAWQAPTADRLDGWSADIETASEGTALSGVRSAAYLGQVRPHMGGRPLIATVYPPNDHWIGIYPYQAMAPYVDAFAPMLYWSCNEPGDQAAMAIQRLGAMAPVHVIGQAFDMAPYGGRVGSPTPIEIARFLDVARRHGAAGASFWVWQYMTAPEWGALGSYPWSRPG
jgi:hypothetical protein